MAGLIPRREILYFRPLDRGHMKLIVEILLRDVSKRLSNLEIEFVGSGDRLPVLSGIEVLRAETKARQVAGR